MLNSAPRQNRFFTENIEHNNDHDFIIVHTELLKGILAELTKSEDKSKSVNENSIKMLAMTCKAIFCRLQIVHFGNFQGRLCNLLIPYIDGCIKDFEIRTKKFAKRNDVNFFNPRRGDTSYKITYAIQIMFCLFAGLAGYRLFTAIGQSNDQAALLGRMTGQFEHFKSMLAGIGDIRHKLKLIKASSAILSPEKMQYISEAERFFAANPGIEQEMQKIPQMIGQFQEFTQMFKDLVSNQWIYFGLPLLLIAAYSFYLSGLSRNQNAINAGVPADDKTIEIFTDVFLCEKGKNEGEKVFGKLIKETPSLESTNTIKQRTLTEVKADLSEIRDDAQKALDAFTLAVMTTISKGLEVKKINFDSMTPKDSNIILKFIDAWNSSHEKEKFNYTSPGKSR